MIQKTTTYIGQPQHVHKPTTTRTQHVHNATTYIKHLYQARIKLKYQALIKQRYIR